MRRSNAGFSLAELMVALAILGVVLAHTFTMFAVEQTLQQKTGRTLETQQDVRLISDAIALDARHSGFLVPRVAGVSSVDGGTAAPDRFCASDPAIFDESEVEEATDHLLRASLSSAVGNAATTVTLTTGHLDIDDDGTNTNDFTVGDGIIIADDDDSHCARITNITTGLNPVITFTPATGGTFNAGTALGRAVPAVIWEVSGTDLLRNNRLISNQIEDLQVEFGVDDDGNGQLTGGEFPVHDLEGDDPSEVRHVRLTIVGRTRQEDPDVTSSGRPAVANRTGGANDGFRRRKVATAIMLRNML